MSQENVETMQTAIDAFGRDGVEAALTYFDPDVEWLGPPDWLEKHIYKGHDGIREVSLLWANLDDFRLDIEKLVDLGDEVLVLLYQRGRLKGSAKDLEQRIAYVARFRNGRIARVQVYFSWEAALEAAGLSEPDAHVDS